VTLPGYEGELRQLTVLELGHEEPTVLSTNPRKLGPVELVTRYAQRMLIANGISEAVQFFHIDALSSLVGMKVDFDRQLTLMAGSLYRMMAHRIGREYSPSQTKTVFSQSVGSVGRSRDRCDLGRGDPGQTRPPSLSGRLWSDRSAHPDALVWQQEADPSIRLSSHLIAEYPLALTDFFRVEIEASRAGAVNGSGCRRAEGSNWSSLHDCISRRATVAVGLSAALAAESAVRGRFSARSDRGMPPPPF